MWPPPAAGLLLLLGWWCLLLAQLSEGVAAAKTGSRNWQVLQSLVSLAPISPVAHNITVAHAQLHAQPSRHRTNASHHDSSVISSWLVFHVPGNLTAALAPPFLAGLENSLRDAVATTLEVCRPAVNITEVRSANVEGELIADLDAMSAKQTKAKAGSRGEGRAIVRRNLEDNELMEYLNLTQIRVAYEVRIFHEMRVAAPDIAQRVDRIQTYSKFAELSSILARSLGDSDLGDLLTDVTLDDIGYASFRQKMRFALHGDELADCVEEGLLSDARLVHQYTMGVSLILVVLITAAGSALFTLKRASAVPSRWNPLANPSPN